MATVITHAVSSLDGYIAGPDDDVGPLFDWYFNGDVPLSGNQGSFGGVSEASAAYSQPFWDAAGAIVVGRRLFDLTNGWNGVPVVGDHMFVVTHAPPADWVPSEDLSAADAPVTFVTTGVADAIAAAAEVAGDRLVTVTAGNVGGQALEAGLVDEVAIDLVPVVFGAGRPYFGDLPASRVMLEDPAVVQGDRVLHLRYRVRKSG